MPTKRPGTGGGTSGLADGGGSRTLGTVPLIPEETVEQVLAATDIVDVIGSYFPLKRAGANYKANCPFHHEKTPSFMVNPARQSFRCFGCGEGGSAIGFVMKYENLPFPEAVRKLAARAGIPVIEETDPAAERSRRQRGRLLELHREAAAFLHRLLLEDPGARHARGYLKSRGYDRAMAERWSVGWMPEQPRAFLDWARGQGYNGRELVGSGLASLKDPEKPGAGLLVRFRDRLMFPIRNDYGEVIAFSGRQLREDPNSGKYINSPETPLFNKSRVLFALDRARRPILAAGHALLCEGQLDVIACHEHGVEQAVAPLGTAFTRHHARLLRRHTGEVILCFDADRAGYAAAERAFRELAPEGLAVRVARMPAGEDPDSFLKAHGAEAFGAVLTSARGFFDFKIDRLRETGALGDAAGRAAAARECAALLAAVGDPLARDEFLMLVATRLEIGGAGLRAEVTAAVAAPRRAEPDDDGSSGGEAVAGVPSEVDPAVANLCQLVLQSPEAKEWLAEQFEVLHEARPYLEGIPLLTGLVCRVFEAGKASAVHAVLATLPDGDRLALEMDPTFFDGIPDDPLAAAQTSLARLSAKALLRRDDRIKAALKEPGMEPERLRGLLEEAKEVRGLLAGIDQRFIFDDREVDGPRARRPGSRPRG